MSEKKYQIFISSTYKDLVEAREKVIETILSMYHFPIGMEMFSADDDDQWQVIKETIDQSDYYVIIIGHRYGSETSEGISYTEKEYDYAKSKGIPILAFIRDRNVATKPDERESEAGKIEKINKFVSKAEANKIRDTWTSIDELGGKVVIALTKQFTKKPRIGWIRADKAISAEMTNELTTLSKENRDLRGKLDELQKQIEDKAPDIDVRFNENNVLKVIYKDLELPLLEYPKPLNIEAVPNYLKKYLPQDAIETYNNADFPTKEEIDSYNKKIAEYYRAKENSTCFSILISNIGRTKANEVFVDLIFPESIVIAEKDEIKDWELPEDIMPENPINIAKRKHEKEKERILSGGFWEHLNSPFISERYIPEVPNLSRYLKSQEYSIDVHGNKVSIKINALMHTRERIFEDFVLIPLEIGEYKVQVTVICEEYLEPKNFTLPLIVVKE